MATNNISDITVSDALREIIESANSESIFYKYKDKKEIAEKIFHDLYTTYSEGKGAEGKKGRGFCLADGAKDIGILSQCQSLQALLLLASDYGLDFDTNYTGKENGKTIRQLMDEVIEDLIEDKIQVDENGNYIFDASPYESDLFTAEYSYVDTIRWIIPTFLLVLQYHASIREICKWEDDLVAIISYGLKYLNDAFIGSIEDTEFNHDKLTFGWNFTKNCEEPSLYFTFAVCECYLSIFRTFEDHISYREAYRTQKNTDGLIPIPEEIQEKYNARQEDYEKHVNLPDPGYVDEVNKIRKRAKYGAEYELVRIYKRINNDDERVIGTPYGDLEKRCKIVANEIWRLVKNDFADNFFYNDLKTKVQQEDIRMSTTSDVLFNSVYIINSIIDAGIDEDIMLKQAEARVRGNEDEADNLQREYNELLETCQLASQKALRSYESLKKEGKEYIVDNFLVGFNENFTIHRDLIKELRKRRMRVFSLLPLLIRTNNIIGEYLVKYPQATMSKYVGYILENRRIDRKGNLSWIWESDGFFSASNYYYVASLSQFYSYYENYEQNYIKISENNNKAVERIRSKYKTELETDGDIAQLNKQIEELNSEMSRLKAEKDSEILKLQTELDSQQNPIEDAVREVVLKTIEKQLPKYLCAFIEKASSNLAKISYEKLTDKKFKVENSPNKDEYLEAQALKLAFDKLFVSLVSDTIYKEVDREQDIDKQYQNASRDIILENARCLATYAVQIMNDDLHQSELFKNK